MKRKIALVICLIMIATMVMTVLVACGEEKIYLTMNDTAHDYDINQSDYTVETNFTFNKGEKKTIVIDDPRHSGQHAILLVSSKKLASVEMTCDGKAIGIGSKVEENGTYMYSFKITFDDYKKASLAAWYAGMGQWEFPPAELCIEAKYNGTEIGVAVQRLADELYSKNKKSKLWTPTTMPSSVGAYPHIAQPQLVWYLNAKDTAKLADEFNSNKAILGFDKESTYENAVETFHDTLISKANEIHNQSNPSEGLADGIVTLATSVVGATIQSAVSAKNFKNTIESLQQKLNTFKKNGQGCLIRIYTQNLDGYMNYPFSCEKYDINSQTYFYGLPGYVGSFTE